MPRRRSDGTVGPERLSDALLIDNSAWVRIELAVLPRQRANEVAEMFDGGDIVVSAPFQLEAGYSARSAVEHARLGEELSAYPYVGVTEAVERSALAAQAQLARVGHHRLPPVDLTIAALADRYGHGILHYDADYDLILEKTDLDYESVWLAPRGSL